MDPTLAAAGEIFEEALGELRGAIDGASADQLNRRPAGEDTNPIAVLAVHAMMSTRMWLACALGTPPPDRDRPSEFRVTAEGATELLSVVDRIAGDCRTQLRTDGPFEAGALRPEPTTTKGHPPPGTTTTAAWALLHALEHLREHAGQAALTRQLVG